LPDDARLRPSNAITISAWLKPSSPLQTARWLDRGTYSTYEGYVGDIWDDGKVSVVLCDGSACYRVASAPGTISPDVWYHYAATFDGKTIKLYINSELESSLELDQKTQIYYITPNTLEIGGEGTITFYYGALSDVMIFNDVALPQNKINQLYNVFSRFYS